MLLPLPHRWASVPTTLALLVAPLFALPVLAQDDPIKFGKVDTKELEMKTYDRDTSADAVVLCDYGQSSFVYEGNEFKILHERTRRVKILKKSGYAHADHLIVLYRDGTDEERVANLKGFTYNLEGGKVVKTKLEKESIFDQKLDEHRSLKKFTMPNVREGSVLEYTYTTTSEFTFTFQSWDFQENIPVVWSEYRAQLLDMYLYKQHMQGYEPLKIATSEATHKSFAVRYAGYDAGDAFNDKRVARTIENENVEARNYRWVAQHVPALREEPNITTLNDYVTRIEFEYGGTRDQNGTVRGNNSTWEDLTKRLLENEQFGLQLNRLGFVRDEAAALQARHADPLARALAIQAHVKQRMKWDGTSRLYVESSLKKAYEAKTGNAADLNLLLVGMLRQAGLSADPVVLSTREHGRNPLFPVLSQYNYVLARLELGDKVLLLDATDPLAPPDLLPFRCLNGTGRIVRPALGEAPLRNNERSISLYHAKLTLAPDGELTGTVEESNGGYNGLALRKLVAKESKEKLVDMMRKSCAGWETTNHQLENL